MTGTPGSQATPARRALNVRALVAGLGPAVLPMVIRDIARDGITLEFEDPTITPDERWATPDAGLLVFFVSMVDEQRRRLSVFARLRQREAHGVVARLVGLEEEQVKALNHLLAVAGRRPPKARPEVPAAGYSPADVRRDLAAVLARHAPGLASSYVEGVIGHLQGLKAVTQVATEHKKLSSYLMELNAARARVEGNMQGRIVQALDALFEHHASALASAESGLSLVESIDLRSSLAVMEAIHVITTRMRASWAMAEMRFACIAPPKSDLTHIAPGTLCHQVRDAIYFDDKLARLRQVDLTTGFTEAFVVALEALYAEMLTVFDRHRVAPAGGDGWNTRD